MANNQEVLWVAFCSNRERSVAVCTSRTREVLAGALPDEAQALEEGMGSYVNVVYRNRERDIAFVDALFEIDSKPIALGCLHVYMEDITGTSGTQEKNRVTNLFASYTDRYGEDDDLLLLKLRWFTFYTNYPQHVAEVERILAKLTDTEAA